MPSPERPAATESGPGGDTASVMGSLPDTKEGRPQGQSAAYTPPQIETATTLGTLRRRLRVLGTRHPRWRAGFQVRRGPLGIQRGYRVTAVDASGAEFGFGVYAGTDETAEQVAAELVALLRSVQGGDDGNA